MSDRIHHIKKAQKEALLLKELSRFFHEITLDDSRMNDIILNRVELSRDKSVCTLLFYTAKGRAYFDEILSTLILYKPSMRKALADNIQSRYVPQLRFVFDEKFEKQMRIEHLLSSIETESKE